MCFYSCNAEKANDKTFFSAIYKELECVDTMKAWFDFFMARDISNWDWRKFPCTKLRKKLMSCSDQIDLRWLRCFFTELIHPQPTFRFSKEELFMYWTEYVDSHHVQTKRDMDYVISSFELSMDCDYTNKIYDLSKAFVAKQLAAIFGETILPYK